MPDTTPLTDLRRLGMMTEEVEALENVRLLISGPDKGEVCVGILDAVEMYNAALNSVCRLAAELKAHVEWHEGQSKLDNEWINGLKAQLAAVTGERDRLKKDLEIEGSMTVAVELAWEARNRDSYGEWCADKEAAGYGRGTP